MFGRRGVERPTAAGAQPVPPPVRRDVERLKREHGVRYYLAHNMTVTPRNLDLAGVIRECRDYGFAMFSFQPAAFVGGERRWHEGYRDTSGDDLWARVEAGAGTRLPNRALQFGDERCNRTAYGFYVGEDWFPLLDDQDPADLHTRDMYFAYLGGMNFAGRSVPQLAA